MPRPPGQKVALVQLCSNLTLQSDRTTVFSYVALEVPEAEGWGIYLSSLRPLTVTRNRTANFQWKPAAQYSIDGTSFSNPVDLCGAISTNGQVIQPALAIGDNLTAPVLRFSLGAANTTVFQT